jgi:hypothetical protein
VLDHRIGLARRFQRKGNPMNESVSKQQSTGSSNSGVRKNHRWLMLVLMCLAGLAGTDQQVCAQSPDGSIPGTLNCDGDCPGVGTSEVGWKQIVSPVTNDCTGTALQLLLHRLEVEIFLQPNQCPLWVIIEPAHGVPTVIEGCCLISRSDIPVMRQALRCRCTRRFIICWDHDCLPDGQPTQISVKENWTASPCAGGSAALPCQQRSR